MGTGVWESGAISDYSVVGGKNPKTPKNITIRAILHLENISFLCACKPQGALVKVYHIPILYFE